MRAHLVWGLGRPQLGLEAAAATRYCRMTILQNVSVVRSHGIFALNAPGRGLELHSLDFARQRVGDGLGVSRVNPHVFFFRDVCIGHDWSFQLDRISFLRARMY
jgi:hypothetical protein